MTESPPEKRPHLWRRRDMLAATGWAGILGSLLAGTVAFVRLLFRRAPVRPPTVFDAGRLEEYRPGSVSERFLPTWRVFIVRGPGELFALHAKCTHLGCTPRWYARGDKFKCPCHGSGFRVTGVNFEGPAPRPLERAKVWTDSEGELWVDVGHHYPHPDWKNPAAFVKIDRSGEPTA